MQAQPNIVKIIDHGHCPECGAVLTDAERYGATHHQCPLEHRAAARTGNTYCKWGYARTRVHVWLADDGTCYCPYQPDCTEGQT